MQLETNPGAPYSVNVGYRVINGKVYVDPAEERRWYCYMKQDPRVRLRFDGETEIYEALAVVDSSHHLLGIVVWLC